MEKQGSILIRRTSKKESWLKYVQSISEKSLELDNYYKEREILYQENDRQQEIVLRPDPLTEIALLGKPAENDSENIFYFGAQNQINREIRKLEEAMEAKERHLRAKARRQPRKPIKLRNYSAARTKTSSSTMDPDQLALPSTATLALPPSTDTPTVAPQENKKQKRKIQSTTQVPNKTKKSRPEIQKERKTVEEIMMAHLPTLQPNSKKTNRPRKIVLLDKALPSSAPPIRKKRRRLASKSDSAKKVKSNLENVSKLNDHGSVFDQFGECSVPPQDPPQSLIEELPPPPSTDKQSSTPQQNDPMRIPAQDKSNLALDYHADFEDSDTEMDQNDSLLTPLEASPTFPIVSTPEPVRPPDRASVSTDSGKESNESIEVQLPSPILELPPVSSREPSPVFETPTKSSYVPVNLAMFETSQYENKKSSGLFHLEDSSDEESIDQDSDNDVVIVATRNKYVPDEVITIDDSDTEPISVDTGAQVEFICYKENNAALGEIEIDTWLDARRLPVEFSYHVGQKIKYGE